MNREVKIKWREREFTQKSVVNREIAKKSVVNRELEVPWGGGAPIVHKRALGES